MHRMFIIGMVLAALAAACGCVRRTITITTEPPGTLVWLNDREVGRTPVQVDFKHYGTYDVRLEHRGYEPMMTSGRANPPWWDHVGLDLFAELTPADLAVIEPDERPLGFGGDRNRPPDAPVGGDQYGEDHAEYG